MEMGHRMGHSRQAQGTAPAEDSGYRVRTRLRIGFIARKGVQTPRPCGGHLGSFLTEFEDTFYLKQVLRVVQGGAPARK